MQSEDFLSDMADAMSELGTTLYRIGYDPDEVRCLTKQLLDAARDEQTGTQERDSDESS